MKLLRSIFLFLIFISFFIHNPFAQSYWHNTFLYDANQITALISNDGINLFGFSANSQTYLRSTDGGANWISVLGFDSSYTFNAGQFVNANTGWLVGINTYHYNGQLYKTTDSGNNWIEQYLGFSTYSLNSVCFINNNTGWIGTYGLPGRILKTTNGGVNWSSNTIPANNNISDVQFINYNCGYAVLGYSPSQVIKTTNSGVNWFNVSGSDTSLSIRNLGKLKVIDSTNCWLLAYRNINSITNTYFYKTSNSGTNWNLIYTYSSNQFNFNKIEFRNIQTGFAYSGANFILKTTNSGFNWVALINPFGTYLNDMYIKNDTTMFTAGGSGNPTYENYVIKSTNGGTNWALSNHNRDFTFTQLQFSNANTGFAYSDTGRIYQTTNFGQDWQLQQFDPSFQVRCMLFNSNNGILTSGGRIKITSNSGNNWTNITQNFMPVINKVSFEGQNNLWAVGDSNRVMRSSNSGLNWNGLIIPATKKYNLKGVSFINNQTGWVIGYNIWLFGSETNLLKTTDGGANWQSIKLWNYDFQTENLKFFDNNYGYVCNYNYFDNLFKTTDGGLTWTNIRIMNDGLVLRSSSFIDDKTFWLAGYDVGYDGTLIKTTNGGQNWLTQFYDNWQVEPSTLLYSVCAIDTNRIMFGCDNSRIYATTNGGGVFGVKQLGNNIPGQFELYQNYPNPFNPETKIKFDVPYLMNVKIVIYDIIGRQVSTIINSKLNAGKYECTWDGSVFASGVYFYSLETEQFRISKKMILLK